MQPTAHSIPSSLPTRALSSTVSNLVHQQHQQPQSFYGPVTALQPYVLHPSCVYPTPQRNTGPLSPALLPTQGNKVNEWQKNKPQGHSQGQQRTQQRQIFYTSKPSFPFEQPQIVPTPPPLPPPPPPPPPPATPPPYLLTSSNYCPGPYSTDHYNNTGVTLIPQPYYKPPDMQALCLVQDRQVISQQQTQQYNSYYNLNNNLQLPNQLGTYAPFANNQLPLQAQIFPSSAQNPINPPKETRSSTVSDLPALKCSRQLNPISCKTPTVPTLPKENNWPPQVVKLSNTFSIPSTNYREFCADIVQNSQANSSCKTQEERFSDESSTSFDFTVEAEKMVSALCNTTSSNDVGKVESGNNECPTLFRGAGDTISSKEAWFPDYSADNTKVEISSSKSVATQTQELSSEKHAELIRKTTIWGCSQAEGVLSSGRGHQDSKCELLMNLSAATRTAIIKSATCFPVFAGDRTFVEDLMNSLFRISNGWLILDNYLNKQHYPSLNDKYDRELIRCFHDWERTTHELLKNIIKTFLQLEEKISEERVDTSGTSGTFPGEISMYTSYDLFESPRSKINLAPGSSLNQESSQNLRNLQYLTDHKKETKLKGKWTITENVSPGLENSKNQDVSLNRVDAGMHVSKLRTKTNISSIKSTSLNAEFFHLRNKVLEKKSPDKWHLKERKVDFNSKRTSNLDSVFRLKYESENLDSCSSQLPRIDPILDPLYVNTSANSYYPGIDNKKYFDSNCETNFGQMISNSFYLGKSSSDPLEFAGIPINKMTLLSQIEPNTSVTNKEEMTANLSAWFASMRNVNITSLPNAISNLDLKVENLSRNSQEVTRNKIDLTRQLQLDGNRQLLSIQNMQSIQSAPWNASNLISNRAHQTHEEYDSSEDTRIYMKPGSYNVPKKRHQKRSNRKSENAASHYKLRNLKDRTDSLTSFSTSRIVTMNDIDENSSSNLRITFPTNTVSSSFSKTSSRSLQKSDSPSEDVTWKAACASAEILLEALNIKESGDQVTGNQDQHQNPITRNQGQKQIVSKSRKSRQEKGCDASSYEASEDDSESSGKKSHGGVGLMRSNDIKLGKANVKTDSWLIRTLNNASAKELNQSREDDLASSDSMNSSLHEDEHIQKVNLAHSTPTTSATEKMRDSPKTLFPNCLKKEEPSENIGKATYSETVRRPGTSNVEKKERSRKGQNSENESVCETILPLQGKKNHRKDVEKSYLLHKSRKATTRKILKDQEMEVQREEKFKVKNSGDAGNLGGRSALGKVHGKKKDSVVLDGKNKTADKGWSVWYSSKRKQLSPLALRKLETIHQYLWHMEDAFIFKYPRTDTSSSSNMIEDYCKIIKNPMFLETIGYKLKNRVYHKIEHALKDFRKIVTNSRLYHKNDDDYSSKIQTLSKKLEELFEEHFANVDIENTSSPRDVSSGAQRVKLPSQRSRNIRKKSPSGSGKTENIHSNDHLNKN